MRLPPLRQIVPVLAACVVLAGCYAYENGPHRTGPARDRIPQARVTGPDESCIPLNRANNSIVRDDRTIDFVGPGGRGWRNVLPSDCPGLGSEKAFSFSTSLSQLCSTDIIRVIQHLGPGISPGASCGLGRFTPIELRR